MKRICQNLARGEISSLDVSNRKLLFENNIPPPPDPSHLVFPLPLLEQQIVSISRLAHTQSRLIPSFLPGAASVSLQKPADLEEDPTVH